MMLAYREIAKKHDPEAVAELDERFRSWGERWHTDEPVTYRPDEWIPTAEAAQLIQISPGALSSLRVNGRITGRIRRVRAQGNAGFEYQVSDVLHLSQEIRRRGPGNNGTGADSPPGAEQLP